MDINWTRHQRFLLRALLTLIASFLLYFTFIRQVRIKINSELIYPIFVQYEQSNNVKVIPTQRRINIIPNGHSTPRGFGIPFGGYFLLPFTILLISKDLKVASGLIGYHLPTSSRKILELKILHQKRVRLKKRNGLQKKTHFVIQSVFLIKK